MHRAGHRGGTAGPVDGRTRVGAGPDLDAGDRGTSCTRLGNYTIVIVTHNMRQAARVSDTTAFFNLASIGPAGSARRVRPTETIFTSPVERATEDYISGRFG